ncbi:MAG: hypothetical protein JWO86_4037 [Myxococcaceae bacterium]|nr:hypothetical protein [Myxococcaceae bacterium]
MHDHKYPLRPTQPGALGPSLEALGEALEKALGDMPLAVMALDPEGRVRLWSKAAELMFGWSADDCMGKWLPFVPRGLEAEAADLRQRSVAHEVQGVRLKRLRKDGTLLDVRLWTSRLVNDEGGVLAILGVMADDSRQLAQERALEEKTRTVELLFEVAVAANESDFVEPALRRTLALVCEFSGWPLGHALLTSESGRDLRSTALWHAVGEPFEAFRRDTEARKFDLGLGLPGRVLASGQPRSLRDLREPSVCPRAESARACGLKGAFAVPVLIHTEVVGVLEFFHVDAIEPDGVLLETMRNVGLQLGRVCERTRAEGERNVLAARAQKATEDAMIARREQTLAPLTAREREVLRCLAQGDDNLTIGACLGIRERTVKAHIGAILRKLGHENRMQAARLAWTLGLFANER